MHYVKGQNLDGHRAIVPSLLPPKSCLPTPGKAAGFEFTKLISSGHFVNFES